MGRVAAVLDAEQPKAFAFLHSGHYQGLPHEVQEFHLEMDRAAERFNSKSADTPFAATVIRGQSVAKHFRSLAEALGRKQDDGYDDEVAPYWKRVDGLLLSRRST